MASTVATAATASADIHFVTSKTAEIVHLFRSCTDPDPPRQRQQADLECPARTVIVFASSFSTIFVMVKTGGLRDYVKEQYEKASRTLTAPEDLREIRERLKSGLKPWRTIRA